ncbi:hypothetical protein ABMA28_005779 [Loxostege sticticalis]|uniref:Lipase domain-containing protein n=1 Tax=Loxostege sticticalis TaxID=481309 RepID=A0ABD0SMT3_LOXSC
MVKFIEHGLLVFSVTAICLANPANNTSDNRFVEIPVEGNRTQPADLEAKPQSELLDHIKKSADINKYLLYTRQNPDSPQMLKLDDEDSILSSNFDPNVPTAVLMHGWQSQPGYGLGPLLTKALLEKRSTNVILLDWRRLSALDYVSSVSAVPSVGRHVGEFLEYLSALTGAPYSSMHLIGHSLGAHIAGNAGRELGGQAARITGLDPAGPLWNFNSNRLKPSDAVYVEAIHTNGGGLGMIQKVADVDFFPNGGSQQPGCHTTVCNHGRSYELFAASVTNNNLIGRKCSSALQVALDTCKGSELPLGNDDLQKTGSGIYRLNTGRKYPYNA